MKNRKCPECTKKGRDSKGDHLFLMEDGVTWHCNKTEIHPPYFERDEEEEVVRQKMTLDDIIQLPITGSIDRNIRKETHEFFRVRTELSTADRSPVAIYYPETINKKLVSFKKRKLPKKFTVVHDTPKSEGVVDPSGWHCLDWSGRRLLITAGEEDMMASYEMLKDKYPDNTPSVISLPRGESDIKPIAEKIEDILRFEEIIICMDQDEAGRKAVLPLVNLIGEKARVMSLPLKDPSDMKTHGREKEFISAYFSAKEYRPSNIVGISDVLEAAIKPKEWGLSYPWEGLTSRTFGLREDRGAIVCTAGAPGSGKGVIARAIQKHLIQEHRRKIAIFDLEETPESSAALLIGSLINKPIDQPGCVYDVEEARRAALEVDKYVEWYSGVCDRWDEVAEGVRYLSSKGVKYFFIDPLTSLVEHLDSGLANQELGRICKELKEFKNQQQLNFFLMCHLNNSKSTKDHAEGAPIRPSEFAGSRAQWRAATIMIGQQRNQYADDPDEKNLSIMELLKVREGGKTGKFYLTFDGESGTFTEIPKPVPKDKEIPKEF